MSVSDGFAQRLNRFLNDNPDWHEHCSCQYAGQGEYLIEISIDVNTHSYGKKISEKEYQRHIGNKIDVIRFRTQVYQQDRSES